MHRVHRVDFFLSEGDGARDVAGEGGALDAGVCAGVRVGVDGAVAVVVAARSAASICASFSAIVIAARGCRGGLASGDAGTPDCVAELLRCAGRGGVEGVAGGAADVPECAAGVVGTEDGGTRALRGANASPGGSTHGSRLSRVLTTDAGEAGGIFATRECT